MKRINFKLFADLRTNSNRWAIIAILVFAVIRVFLIQIPQLDRTEWKEIDYITISKNYTKEGVKFWEPTISWPAEEPRVTAMEFPLVPYSASILYRAFGFNAFTVRALTSILFIVFAYYFYKTVILATANRQLAFLSLILALILPLNFIFGRLLFSGPAIITSVVLSVYHLLKWKQAGKRNNFVYAFIFLGLGVLLKPTTLYVALPLLYIYYLKKNSFRLKHYSAFALAIISAIIPAAIWYGYAYHLTQSSIDVFGVFGGHNKFQTIRLLATLEWWKTMYLRLSELFGGRHMFLIFSIGVIAGLWKRRYHLFHVLLLSNLAFMFIVAEGHLDAPYRQFAFIASGSFFIALGLTTLASLFDTLYSHIQQKISTLPGLNKGVLFAGIIALLMANFGYDLVTKLPTNKDYIYHPTMYKVARKLDRFKTDDSKIITTGNYGVEVGGNALCPVLYYYSNLQGWSLQQEDWDLDKIKQLKAKGADLFVGLKIFTNEAAQFNEKVEKKYKTLHQTDKYIICDLTQKARKP